MLQLLEGFDHLTATQLAVKGWSFDNSLNGFTEGVVSGRTSGNAYYMHFGGGGGITPGHKLKGLPSGLTDFVCGFAMLSTMLPKSGANIDVFILRAGSTAVVRVNFDYLGVLRFLNSGGSVIGVSTLTILTSVWNHIEMKGTIAAGSSVLDTQVNGGPDLTAVTCNLGSSAADNVQLQIPNDNSCTQHHEMRWDDIYITDQVSPNDDFLGDCHIQTIRPAADGFHSDWVPDTGSAHFSRVNDNPPNDDSSYVSSNTLTDRDSFALHALTGAGDVQGIQINQYVRKSDPGYRQIAPIIRMGGTTYTGTDQALSASYTDKTQIYDQDPTNVDWTINSVNAAEFGTEIT
jgi:hypothetical protein